MGWAGLMAGRKPASPGSGVRWRIGAVGKREVGETLDLAAAHAQGTPGEEAEDRGRDEERDDADRGGGWMEGEVVWHGWRAARG